MSGSRSTRPSPERAATTLAEARGAAIDKKMDDGYPQLGVVQAFYSNQAIGNDGPTWASGGNVAGKTDTSATAGSSITCFDNGDIAGAIQQYSQKQNNGNGVNCALSFKFQ